MPTAAFCPWTPLLVAGATGGTVREVEALRTACRQVIQRLVTPQAFPVTLVGPDRGSGGVNWSPTARGTVAGLGLPDDGDGRPLPLSLAVGRRLLRDCGVSEVERQVAVSENAPAGECLDLGRSLRGTTLLVLADGSCRRGDRAPGGGHPLAAEYDAGVARALRSGDATALAELDSELGSELGVSGRATWQVLAGWAAGSRVTSAALAYDAAPFGVGYLAGSWSVA